MKWILFFTSIIIVSGCTYDNEAEYYGNTCDTLNVTFNQTIKPILDINCVACHNGTISNGGVNLDNYSNVKALAANGKLLGVIDHQPGFKTMPPATASKLDDCSIDKIRNWIEGGAQND